MMKRFVFLILVFVPILLTAQKPIELKKKYFGSYEGQISSFQLDGGNDLIDVDSVPIRVSISQSNVQITVGKQMNTGLYSVLFEGDKYFVLDCRMEGQLAGERLVIFKHGKKISREGLYPQPNTFLLKVKD
ncbi:MAG: hypothetical protein RI922_1934 [Bacteroidota bacterium]|jgi:hypothetical protein